MAFLAWAGAVAWVNDFAFRDERPKEEKTTVREHLYWLFTLEVQDRPDPRTLSEGEKKKQTRTCR